MKKILGILCSLCAVSQYYFTFVYHATYSEGVRSGQLIKFSYKGVVLKLGKEK
jgi:hypothetical protein